MKSDKELLDSVEMSLRHNMGKAIISLLVIILITSFSVPIVMVVTILFAGTLVLPFAALLFFVTIIVMLALGYLNLLTNLHRRQPAILGHIFSAFYQFKNNFFLALIIAAVLVALSSIISVIGLFFVPVTLDFSDPNSFLPYFSSLAKLLPLLSGIFIIIFFLGFIIPNGFIWFVKQEDSSLSIKETFIKSWNLAQGKKLHLLKFLLKSGSWWLFIAATTYIATLVINWKLPIVPTAEPNSSFTILSFLMNICNITYSITFYCSIIRIFTGLVVFYDEITDSQDTEKADMLEISAPVLKLTEQTEESQPFSIKEEDSPEQNSQEHE